MLSRFENFHRLYRDTERGVVAGVCAGIADYFGLQPLHVRFVAVLLLIFFFFPTVIVYAALSFLLKPKPPALYHDVEEERFWRGVRTAPDETLGALRYRFKGLEQRLARMEGLVTSEEYELRRKFRDIES